MIVLLPWFLFRLWSICYATVKLTICSYFQFQEIRYRAIANFVPSVTGLRPWEEFRVGANRGIGLSVRNPRASRVDRLDP
jgi:hypothetical protein